MLLTHRHNLHVTSCLVKPTVHGFGVAKIGNKNLAILLIEIGYISGATHHIYLLYVGFIDIEVLSTLFFEVVENLIQILLSPLRTNGLKQGWVIE